MPSMYFVPLMKHETGSYKKDLEFNQKAYSEKLDLLIDISHVASEQVAGTEEDPHFLKMQRVKK